MKYVLGVDLGTSSTKTVLFESNGRQVCEATREYPLYQPQNGWAEQEPEDWWDAGDGDHRMGDGESPAWTPDDDRRRLAFPARCTVW